MLLKRCVDIVLSALILLLMSPVLLGATLAVWLDSGSPVLFRQERVGLGFRRFYILKFRTMRHQSVGPSVTVDGDSRILRVGRFLRLSKIDELPQFWNVLRGEMSVVGPRPEVPEYVEMYNERFRRILAVRPGITDLASICFRDEESILAQSENPLSEYKERILPIKLDLADKYIQEQSILIDLTIILRTAVVTLWKSDFPEGN
jgi:lipopolysaccharide/colanic/teichoic acid biosynthesis glycosyltransferase